MTTVSGAGDARLLLNAYVDGELDAAAALDVERQLAADPGLAGEHARLVALRQAIRERLPRETAPSRLRDAVLSIARPEPSAAVTEFRPRRSRGIGMALHPGWLALAAVLLIGLAIGSLAYVLTPPSGGEAVSAALDAAVAGHVRALAAGTPFDVASSDRHTVKPWFAGKVTFAPQVIDLADEGFPLAGGRIDVVGGSIAASLVYRRDKHLISLTAVPDPSGAFGPASRGTRDGFAFVHWSAKGIAYWAISDAAPDEVDAFAAAFRGKAPDA